MPKRPLYAASFYVHRPDDYPAAADYPAMLQVLQRSCDRVGVRHVVLTDAASIAKVPTGITMAPLDLPRSLMKATTKAHADFLEFFPVDGDVLFIGADSIFVKDPRRFYPKDADLCVTLRPGHSRYPINNGAMLVRREARDRVAPLYRKVADACGERWGDDQRGIADALEPLPKAFGVAERAGLTVRFLPMSPFNAVPQDARDPASGAVMLHFRGRKHKPKFFSWAARWMA